MNDDSINASLPSDTIIEQKNSNEKNFKELGSEIMLNFVCGPEGNHCHIKIKNDELFS